MEQGLATIVFTDVEGSTALAQAVGDERARELIERQREIVRRALGDYGGREIDTAGDGFMLAFGSVRRALLFARTVQDGLAERGEGIRVRIGLHAGEVLGRDEHPFGAAVNGAARIAALAAGGQVLLSETVRQLAGEARGLSFRDRGRKRLKGFEQTWRLYELDWEGRREMPPLVTKPTRGPRRWLYLAAAAFAIVAGLAAWLAWPSGAKPLIAPPNSVAAIDPKSGRVVAVVPTGSEPAQVAAAGHLVWVASVPDRTVTVVDTRMRRALRTLATPLTPLGIAAVGDTAWATDVERFVELDPRLGPGQPRVWPSRRPPVGSGSGVATLALAVHEGSLWSAYYVTLARAPLARGNARIVSSDLNGFPRQLAFMRNTVWSADGNNGVDSWTAATGTTHIPGPGLTGIVAQRQALWATDTYDNSLVRINPLVAIAESEMDTFAIHAKPNAIASVEGELWTADDDGTLMEFDPETQKIVRRIRVGGSLAGIAYDGKLLWVTVQQPSASG